MANNLEIEAQRQALVTSIREAAQILRECANKTDSFANYLQNVFPVPQPFSFQPLQSASLPALVPDGPPVKRKPGRPKKADHDEDLAAADDGAPNGDGKKRKRPAKEKKPKDPNAPKRPPSAYLLYQNHVRKEVQAANPNMPYSEILTHISKAWGRLSEKEKEPYSSATELAKGEYEKKKAAYEATLKPPEAVKSPADAASVPALQDTSEDDEPEHPAPAPVITTTAARIKSPLVGFPAHGARSAQVVKQEEGSSDEDGEDDEEEEEEEEKPPPKKRVRKSEHVPSAPVPVLIKEKEKEKEKAKKEKERKERKEKKHHA